jgi:hypothetical protein
MAGGQVDQARDCLPSTSAPIADLPIRPTM